MANLLAQLLAGEILDSAPPVDFVQFAATMPGFSTKGGVGRNFHIDGGQDRALGVFNMLQGVALTDVASDTAGGFHVLPGSHRQFAELFGQRTATSLVRLGFVPLLVSAATRS